MNYDRRVPFALTHVAPPEESDYMKAVLRKESGPPESLMVEDVEVGTRILAPTSFGGLTEL